MRPREFLPEILLNFDYLNRSPIGGEASKAFASTSLMKLLQSTRVLDRVGEVKEKIGIFGTVS